MNVTIENEINLLPEKIALGVMQDRMAAIQMKEYVPNPGYPLFEETMVFLVRLAHHYKPTTIIDAGSGVSSMILRKYAPDAHIISVDHDRGWLETTKRLCDKFEVNPSGEFITWDKFLFNNTSTYSFIVHDMGNMLIRKNTLIPLISIASTDAIMLLDNIGVADFKTFALAQLYKSGFTPIYPTNPELLDNSEAGRFGSFKRGSP